MRRRMTWVPFWTLFRRECMRFQKVAAQTLLTPLINASLYLLIFGVSLGQHIELGSGLSYLAFLIPGLVMMGCLNNAFQNSSSSVGGAKFAGELEDFKVTPLSDAQIIWALSFGGLARGLMVGLITYVVGQVFHFGVEGRWLGVEHPLVLFFFLIIGGLVFAQVGLMVAFWAKTFDQLSIVGGFILLPLLYLGGVFFSIESLHPFWRGLAQFNPLLYLINGVRYGVLGVSDVSLGLAAMVSLLALGFMYFLALRLLRVSSFSRW